MTRWLATVAVLFMLAATTESAPRGVEPAAEAAPMSEAAPAPETPDPAGPDEALFGPPEPQPAICCICCDGCDERYNMCSGACWNQPNPAACESACLAERDRCYSRCPYSCP